MTHLGYILAGWGSFAGAIGFYAFTVIRRGRRLAEVVPPQERRWS